MYNIQLPGQVGSECIIDYLPTRPPTPTCHFVRRGQVEKRPNFFFLLLLCTLTSYIQPVSIFFPFPFPSQNYLGCGNLTGKKQDVFQALYTTGFFLQLFLLVIIIYVQWQILYYNPPRISNWRVPQLTGVLPP